jgi:hypothetical protein
VLVEGTIKAAEVKSCTIQEYEVQIHKVGAYTRISYYELLADIIAVHRC